MAKRNRYPIGQQDFSIIRLNDALYVDKTEYIERIIESKSLYYFLARPRRFGKSLFLSTIRYFFEGRRELFKGLYIDSADWEWESYPVLRLDLNVERFEKEGILDKSLDNYFNKWEREYGVETKAETMSARFSNIIMAAHEHTGRPVVILVDEYNKPLVANLNNPELFESYRQQLASLYSNFKSSVEHIRLVFLTGVSRFSRLSVFSDLNNINDITLDNDFADICGITETELRDNFGEGIRDLADNYGIDYEDACDLLKKNYDGYRFAKNGNDIYNPWSLLNCLSKKDIGEYWNETGLPTILAESLKRANADLQKTFDSYCSESELKGLDLLNPNPKALLYQTGYLTIKQYYGNLQQYRLGIPNREVRNGLFTYLLPYYIRCKSQTPNELVSGIYRNFIFGEPDEAMKAMQAYFAGIDFKMRIDNENNFHNAFYLLMDLIGLRTKTEVHTSDGSIDIMVETEDYIYIIELKYDHSAQDALRQIKEKQYARPYLTGSRQLFLIGVSFSSASRCIEDWTITKES